MPRAKKTMQGAPGQAVGAITGQTYGEGARQEQLQKAMPTPNIADAQAPRVPAQQAAVQSATPAAEAVSVPERTQPEPVDLQQALRGMGGLLRQPDDKPGLPVTDGLNSGPGRGTEALMRTSQLGNTLRRLAMQTNDPVFAELASKIGL